MSENMDDNDEVCKMSNENEYLEALQKIRVLLLNVTDDFEPEDDEISHFFENLYDLLDKVIPM
jgi:hypothetical protein